MTNSCLTNWRKRLSLAGADSAESEVINMSNAKTFPLGRNAKTGQFVEVKEAQRKPSTHIVERIPKSGYGDTKK